MDLGWFINTVHWALCKPKHMPLSTQSKNLKMAAAEQGASVAL